MKNVRGFYMIKSGDMIPPAWMIEAIEKLRKEQEQRRPELRIEMPMPMPMPPRRDLEDEKEQEDSIIISLR